MIDARTEGFSENQIAAIRVLANAFLEGKQTFSIPELSKQSGLNTLEMNRLLNRLIDKKLVSRNYLINARDVWMKGEIVDLWREIESIPPKDYWEEYTRKFRSKWWSVPLIAFVVFTPFVLQLIEWGKWLVKIIIAS